MAQMHVDPEGEANRAAADVARFLIDLFDKGLAALETIPKDSPEFQGAALGLALLAKQLDRMLVVKHYVDREYVDCLHCALNAADNNVKH